MEEKRLMPTLFIGHGTPMNAIEDNEFSANWKKLAKAFAPPKAILCISAHWETKGSMVTSMEKPRTIHDFGGFPETLYRRQYPAPGHTALAECICNTVSTYSIKKDYRWGLDHGAWCFLNHIYPEADVPVVELSINSSKGMQFHYDLGKELAFLRHEGVLIVGSGNMIHNLWLARADENGFNNSFGYDWAHELNSKMKEAILAGNHNYLIHYTQLSKDAVLGIPTEEHYIPLMYILALQTPKDKVEIFNDKVVAGSLSMTSLMLR